MDDYERVARVIEYIDKHFRDQPSLESLAAVAGLSPFHFHRVFCRWAGTSPKALLQHLTGGAARRLLRDGADVLDVALAVGLSGPGRLHDLCVKLEGASPGEIKSGGSGWEIRAGYTDTPFGAALIAVGPRGICRLAFPPDEIGQDSALAALGESWPNARLIRDDRRARGMAKEIFSFCREGGGSEPLRILVRGTPFQFQVWRALVEIPFGDVRSYGQIARAIGSPRASRAVGTAIGSNPVAVLIPCHRVIQASGRTGNYHWGATRKKALLTWERLRSVQPGRA